jgi:hypothetical protein
VSEAELPERLGKRPTPEDIRALVGPATPHFALQIRNRVQRLIAPLPDGDPARVAGENAIADLEELAKHSGDPRGMGPADEPELHDEGRIPGVP